MLDRALLNGLLIQTPASCLGGTMRRSLGSQVSESGSFAALRVLKR
jgi:hypothetical protein